MRIAIVAPGRRLPETTAERLTALARDAAPEAELVIHPQCFESHGHFAGPDAARAGALVEMANDPAVDAIWFARGGYGAGRIAGDVIARLEAPARAKTYLGYSDCGFLLAALYKAGIGTVAHGPVANDLVRAGGEAAAIRAMAFLATRDAASLEASDPPGARRAAFNLTVLAHLCGTDLLPDLSGHVLLLEEVSEPLYRIDRAFCQLAGTDWFGRLAGLRLGRVSDIVPNDIDFAMTAEEIAKHWCARAGIAYLGPADIGHDAGNKVVVFG